MKTKYDFLDTIQEAAHRLRVEEVFQWIEVNFPTLEFRIAWNQPIYTHQETFIIGFSIAKQHLAISPETKGIQTFIKAIEKIGYTHSSNLFRIQWKEEINYSLLSEIIMYNMKDKAECTTFWRK